MKIIDFRVNNTLYRVTKEKVAVMEGKLQSMPQIII